MATRDVAALSSQDGVDWWGAEGRLAPLDLTQPLTHVRRLVLGDLQPNFRRPPSDALTEVLKNVAGTFPALTHLHLWHVSALTEVGGLPETLQCLDLRGCSDLREIQALPESTRLQMLDLADCPQLTELPIANVSALKQVWLHGCLRLGAFGPLRPAVKNLDLLELHDCRFKDLSADLCGQTGENVAAKVRQHFAALQQDNAQTLPLAECKLIVLGDGGVGKTSLVRALKGFPHDPDEKITHGIRLWRWDGGTGGTAPELFPECPDVRLDLNIWDFGGQDLYHNTHRLFLETQAVFVIVERSHEPGKPRRLEAPDDIIRPLQYWLDHVDSATAGSQHRPAVLIVRTGIDDACERNTPLSDWKERATAKHHDDPYYKLSCCDKHRGTEEWTAFRAELLNLVRQQLGGAEAVMQPLGRVKVRQELRKSQPGMDDDRQFRGDRPLLRRHEFDALVKQIYQRHELSEPDHDELHWQLDFFHQRGVVYAPSSWREEHLTPGGSPVVVDQRWLIHGMYELLGDGDLRCKWSEQRGLVTRNDLFSALDHLQAKDATLQYDSAARWAMLACMEHFGLFVPLVGDDQERGYLPEFLPLRDTVFKPLHPASEHGFLSEWEAKEKNCFCLQDANSGLSAGCQLIGWLVRTFGFRGWLFRYGALVNLQISGAESGGQRELPLEIQWERESNQDFFGTLRLWLPADCRTVDEVLTYVEQGLQGRRIVPKEASFQPNTSARAGGTLSGSLGIRSFASLPRPERWGSTISVQPVVTLGRVGISMAGDENPESDREYWPRLLCELLRQHSQNRFQVICYRDSDHQTRSTDQLIGDLAACDLLIAVISEKYLKSKYCMVELLLAARKWSIAQNEHHSKAPDFLGDHKEWLPSIWFVILKEVEELCVKDAAISDDARAWSNEWYEQGFEYTNNLRKRFRNDALAQEHGAGANAYDAWMRFVATGEEAAKKFLAAIRHSNDRPILSLQDRRVDEDRDTWASGLLAPYITNKLLPAILTKLDGMDPSQRIQRCVEIAIRYQQRGDVAGFDQYVNQALRESPNSPVVATQLQEGNLPSGFEALRPYLADWKQRQGSGAN